MFAELSPSYHSCGQSKDFIIPEAFFKQLGLGCLGFRFISEYSQQVIVGILLLLLLWHENSS
jgi:hypothetical protein